MRRKITLFRPFCLIILLYSMYEDVQAQSVAITEKMGNFTMELLFHTMTTTREDSNLILSPVSMWSLLLALSRGSNGLSRQQIKTAIRVNKVDNNLREALSFIRQFTESASIFEIYKFNVIFEDKDILPQTDFISTSLNYGVDVLPLSYSNPGEIDQKLSAFKLLYPQLTLFNSNDIKPGTLLPLTSLNLKGKWLYSFDTVLTTKQPFYNTQGNKIGHVNMMYNRHTYSVTKIDGLKARAIKLPYANSFSMIILLPDTNVSLKEALYGFANITFDLLVKELDSVEHLQEEILAVIPRFHIRSSIDMKPVLNNLGIYDVFDDKLASLPLIARSPTYVNKFIHNVEIDVTESGFRQSPMESVIGTRVGVASFIANKPFLYFIVEKNTNSIMFCGKYQVPVLY